MATAFQSDTHAHSHKVDHKLFDVTPEGFVWATGIEDTFVAQTERVGERILDEYALIHHYLYWREDLDRAAGLGIRAMRYGIPWYKVEPAPGRFDWDWVDQVLEYLSSKGVAVIADLIHYGTPLWLDNQFLNSSYPQRVANYQFEFASRYRHLLSHYTPLNEPLINMEFCGERGIWPPYLRGSDGSVKILRQLTRGIVLSCDAIRQADPAATIVHIEAASEYLPETTELASEAEFLTHRAYLATDLVTGKVDERHPMADWLLQNGMSEADLDWHRDHGTHVDVIGTNYYPDLSVYKVRSFNGVPGLERIWGGVESLEKTVRGFAARFNVPLFLSETSVNGSLDLRSQWMSDSIQAISRLRSQGTAIVGYTWWPLFSHVDWIYREGTRPVESYITRLGPPELNTEQIGKAITAFGWKQIEQLPLDAYVVPMGLYDLEMQFDGMLARIETPLVNQYRQFIQRPVASLGSKKQLSH